MSRFVAPLVLLVVAIICGCSGGGTSSSGPPQPVYTGSGSTAAIDQKISFTITVPATSGSSAIARRTAMGSRRAASAVSPSPLPTTPYISPATGAIVLSLAEINGISPQVVPPAIPTIAVTCQGCTFSVPNIPAATGIDRYFVQTYSGYANGAATGNLISTGFVDVIVPVTSTPTLGGAAALSIGGFVANITFAPHILTFSEGVESDQNLLVHALDAGGATIIGNVQYANPIVVSLGNAKYFTLDGSTSETLNGTQQKPIDVHYNGDQTYGTTVSATSQNGNGVAVAATPGILNVVSPTATPIPPGHTAAPSPSPTLPPPKTSLYVADASTDTVSEYGFVTQLEAGNAPNPVPTPQRVMQFNLPGVQNGPVPLLTCNFSSFISGIGMGNGTSGVVVANNGTIFTLPNCFDGTNTYVFGFPATSVGLTTPTIYDPIAETPLGAYGGNGMALAYDPVASTVFAAVLGSTYAIAGFSSTSNNQQPSVVLGGLCYQEFGQPSCSGGSGAFTTGYGGGFGIDGQGNSYIPAYWTDPAIGDAALLTGPPAILTVALSASSSSVTTPQVVIGGLNAQLGGQYSQPLAAAVDGTTLFVLVPGYNLSSADGSTNYYPGLSSCPSPSPNAPVNTIFTTPGGGAAVPAVNCLDGESHEYLVAYPLDSQLLSPLSPPAGTVVDLTPELALGGDVVGRFGCGIASGQYLAASAGYVYIINTQPENCNTAPYAPEIDIYDTNGLSGFHTDIAPKAVINLNNGYPSALAIGPSGTVTGGQALLRHPAIKRSHSTSMARFGKIVIDKRHWPGWLRGKLVPYPQHPQR